jgi:hypothetical protein
VSITARRVTPGDRLLRPGDGPAPGVLTRLAVAPALDM